MRVVGERTRHRSHRGIERGRCMVAGDPPEVREKPPEEVLVQSGHTPPPLPALRWCGTRTPPVGTSQRPNVWGTRWRKGALVGPCPLPRDRAAASTQPDHGVPSGRMCAAIQDARQCARARTLRAYAPHQRVSCCSGGTDKSLPYLYNRCRRRKQTLLAEDPATGERRTPDAAAHRPSGPERPSRNA